jgi:acetyl-CoA carboxylase biotin carboxylase subunit
MSGFDRILVANRGEIAARVIQACRRLGIQTVLAASEVDRDGPPAELADRVVVIGPARADQSYLKVDTVVTAALGAGCQAIHPGYGFLAEQPELAEKCEQHGLAFIGPSAENIRRMGDKLEARRLAGSLGVPVIPGSELIESEPEALAAAEEAGYPVLLKAAAGGGGKGIKIARGPDALRSVFHEAAAEARSAFGDDRVYIERWIPDARHVEVQVFGDHHGNAAHLFERDCSLQRRYQKMVEEAPSPAPSDHGRQRLCEAALKIVRHIGYKNAGTVEFIWDRDAESFYFLEMNTRIQVEHPVTEMITGIDLVAEQINVAAGSPLSFTQDRVRMDGWAVECRITAEDPQRGFQPTPGRITRWSPPRGAGVRLDTHCRSGVLIPPHYDSLLAKLIVHGSDRAEAVAAMRRALAEFDVQGVSTTIPFLRRVIDHPDFAADRYNTRWVEQLTAKEP